MLKAILVTFSVTTRIIANVSDEGETLSDCVPDSDFQIAADRAIVRLKDAPGEHYDTMEEDEAHPFNPDTDAYPTA